VTSVTERRAEPPLVSLEPDIDALAARVDEALRASAALDGNARKVAEEVRESIEAVHRAVLVTIVRRLRQDDAGRAALYELVDDPLVHTVFSLHGIVRADPASRARAALESVRLGLQSHGGDVELVRVEEGTAYVRLSGACNGCSMSAVTMRSTVEQALLGADASVTAVEVLPSEPGPALIPLSAVGRPGTAAAREAGWVEAGEAAALPDGRVTRLALKAGSGEGADVIVVRLGASLTAYRNECAHEALPLHDAVLEPRSGTLTCPWHGFCYDAVSGDCLSAPGAALEQLPLRVDDGRLWIRVGS
jgi:nitrite reductase/ring-hydroxylating ferredoxin subunit/Fe-S cluster biogenesis protein NfuA